MLELRAEGGCCEGSAMRSSRRAESAERGGLCMMSVTSLGVTQLGFFCLADIECGEWWAVRAPPS